MGHGGMPHVHRCYALVNIMKERRGHSYLPGGERWVCSLRKTKGTMVREGTDLPQGGYLHGLLWESIWGLSDAARKQGSQHLPGHDIPPLSIFLFLFYLIKMAILLHDMLLCLSY